MGLPARKDEQGYDELELLSSGQVASFITHPGTGRVLCLGGGFASEIEHTLTGARYVVRRLDYRSATSTSSRDLSTAVATYLPDVIYAVVDGTDPRVLDAVESIASDRRTDAMPLVAVVPSDAEDALIEELYSRTGCDFLRAGTTRVELLARTHAICRYSRATNLLVPTPALGSSLLAEDGVSGGRPMVRAANDPAPREAFADPATGLYTPAYFEHRLPTEVARARRYERDMALVAVRCPAAADNDENALEVASILRRSLRSADIAARLEADLFVAVLPEADVEQLFNLCDRLADDLAVLGEAAVGTAGLDANRGRGGHSPAELVRLATANADRVLGSS